MTATAPTPGCLVVSTNSPDDGWTLCAVVLSIDSHGKIEIDADGTVDRTRWAVDHVLHPAVLDRPRWSAAVFDRLIRHHTQPTIIHVPRRIP